VVGQKKRTGVTYSKEAAATCRMPLGHLNYAGSIVIGARADLCAKLCYRPWMVQAADIREAR
jgi:hypothetical protein